MYTKLLQIFFRVGGLLQMYKICFFMFFNIGAMKPTHLLAMKLYVTISAPTEYMFAFDILVHFLVLYMIYTDM